MQFKLKEMLDARGITQYQLAKALELSQPSVNAWINGRTRNGKWSPVYPEYEVLERICSFLKCGVQEILVFDPSAMTTTFEDFKELVAA